MSGQLSRPANSRSDLEAVITEGQVRGQRQVAQHVPLAVVLVRTALGQFPGAHLAAARTATTLELHGPVQQRVLLDRRRIDARGARTVAQHHHIA